MSDCIRGAGGIVKTYIPLTFLTDSDSHAYHVYNFVMIVRNVMMFMMSKSLLQHNLTIFKPNKISIKVMWIILVLLLTGSIAGYYLSGVKSLNALSEKISMYTIYILLFFMGLNVGTKPEIMKNLAGIGFDALLIALFAIAGSVLMSYLLFRFILPKNEE